MKCSLVLYIFFASVCVFAAENNIDRPLFTEKELSELKYLKSNEHLVQQSSNELSKKSQERMRAALKIYAAHDQKKREAYFKGDIWAIEDKRENYFALLSWLERISPLSKVKNKMKDTK